MAAQYLRKMRFREIRVLLLLLSNACMLTASAGAQDADAVPADIPPNEAAVALPVPIVAGTKDTETPKVPQVPPTRVEGTRKPVKPTEPPATEPQLNAERQQAERLKQYLKPSGRLAQPIRLDEVSRGGKPPFLQRQTIIDPSGYWERQWVIGDRVIPGATGQMTGEELQQLADTMARYDLAAQPRVMPTPPPRFSRRVAYENVALQFGQDRWQAERLFAESKPEADPKKASPHDRLVLITQQLRSLTGVKNGFPHPINTVARPYDQINSRRLFIPSGSRHVNGSP